MNEQTQKAIELTLEVLLEAFTTAHQTHAELTTEIQLYIQCDDLHEARTILVNDLHLPEDKRRRPHWPNPPTSEVLTERNGDGEYLYLYFSQGEGPTASKGTQPRRRVYIGNKPRKIELARTMAANIRQRQQLASRRATVELRYQQARRSVIDALRHLALTP